MNLKAGMKVTCTIKGTIIDDAKIQIQNSRIYICQNKREGSHPTNMLGYNCGWSIGDASEFYMDEQGVTDLKIIQQDWDEENNEH